MYLVGKSNRSKVLFEQELDAVIDAVPEVAPVAASPAAPAAVAATPTPVSAGVDAKQ